MFMVMIWYTNYLYIDTRGIHFDDNDNDDDKNNI